MKPSLPLTAALAPLAKEYDVDLTQLATAEIEFERKCAELEQWLKDTRPKFLESLEHGGMRP